MLHQLNKIQRFFVNAILLKEKYLSFPENDRKNLEGLISDNFSIKDIKIKSPNNPAKLLEAKLLSFRNNMKIASLFTGAGGLDLGFERAGFDVVWANEYDSTIWETFEHNFPKTKLDKRSIVDVPASEIPDVDGIIGGPPCQSWSEAGAGRGINDKRGQLFYDYIRLLKKNSQNFFLQKMFLVFYIQNTKKHSQT